MPTEPNSDLKAALLAANGQTLYHRGRRWRLLAYEGISKAFNTPYFRCSAENLTPKDADEAKYCITDLWQSESDDAAKLLLKFAALGGYRPENPYQKGRW